MRERKASLIFGINPVVEKLRHAPAEISEIIVVPGSLHAGLQSIVERARQLGLPVRSAKKRLLNRLSGTNKHQGVVARVADYVFYSLGDLLRDVSLAGSPVRILAVDGVTDPRNLGALLRTAEGAGIRHVLIPEHRAAGITPAVAKTSAGAINYLKICRVANLHRALVVLKEAAFWVIGLDAGAGQIYGRSYPQKLVIVVGSEGSGIRPLIRRECDFLVGVPMRGNIESLNVAVATGIFLYELLRQEACAQAIDQTDKARQ